MPKATITHDYLWWAIALSALVHLLIVFWPSSARQTPSTESLNISLVNFSTQEVPLQALIKAQANLEGGGEHQQGQSSSPLPYTAWPDPNELVLRAMQKRLHNLEQTQQRLLSQLHSQTQAPHNTPQQDYTGDASYAGKDDLEQAELIAHAHIAQIQRDITRYQQRPRFHYSAPSAIAVPEAEYVENWRQQIEQTGTLHYPHQGSNSLHGSLQLSVYIARDGSVLKTQVDQAADHPELNLAAQRIVQLAAPFNPVPPQVAPDSDVLVITRYWHFTEGGLHTQAQP